ncbi:hypothetical protein PF007_g11566 [Phytophthora fragariae]|uniref:Uncharacterized protein n=1 Tax=Phytophthora fragariae TaxID=53985 RepID=A0A6A3S7B1_9STRA|nr:hypothetical protein PF007_g11566 [Phytophthora fragariae]
MRCELDSSAPLQTVISDELRKIVGSQKPAHIEFWDDLRDNTDQFNSLCNRGNITYAPRVGKHKITVPVAYVLYEEYCKTAGHRNPLKRSTFINMSRDLSFIHDCKKTKGVDTFYFGYTPSIDDGDDDDDAPAIPAAKLCIKCKQNSLPMTDDDVIGNRTYTPDKDPIVSKPDSSKRLEFHYLDPSAPRARVVARLIVEQMEKLNLDYRH